MKGEFLSLETAKRLAKKNKKIYALYKGEELLSTGTMQEIASDLGVRVSTIKFYKSPVYKKRGKGKNRRELIEI